MKNQVFLTIDTETTGTDVFESRVVTCGYAAGTRDDVFFKEELLFQVDVDIPEEAAAIHGITTEKANEKGLPRQFIVNIAELIEKCCVNNNYILVAYNASFDLTILKHEFDRLGIDPLLWEKIRIMDPYVLDKHLDKYRKGSRNLSSTFRHYIGEELDGAHGATTDAIASLRVLFAIIEKYGEDKLTDKTLNELTGDLFLNEIQESMYGEQSRSLQAYLLKAGREITSPFNHQWPIKSRSE